MASGLLLGREDRNGKCEPGRAALRGSWLVAGALEQLEAEPRPPDAFAGQRDGGGLEVLERSGYQPTTSERGAAGLALPVPVLAT